MRCKHGFISLPFLILLSLCLSLSSFLSYKISMEFEMMEDLKEVNFQVQHERKILECINGFSKRMRILNKKLSPSGPPNGDIFCFTVVALSVGTAVSFLILLALS